MAMGRVRAGFFHTRTRPAGQDPWPGPAPFRIPGFFPGPRPAPAGPHGPHGPRLEIGPNSNYGLFSHCLYNLVQSSLVFGTGTQTQNF